MEPYPDPERREEELDRAGERAGAEILVYGHSHEGRPLRAARLPATAGGDVPTVMVTANIHGVEYIGNRVAMALLDRLATGDDEVTDTLRSRAHVVVAPCLNPDGYARTWARDGVGKVRELRTNARGVDLNRNFPLPAGVDLSRLPGTGSLKPGAATYRGPAPLSEPEARALAELLDREDVHASVGLHSFMGSVIPPKVTTTEDRRGYRELHRALAGAQQRPYFLFASASLDRFTGELEDHQHHHRRTWAVCLEVFSVSASIRQHVRAPSTFWRFNPHDPAPWIANDVPAVLAYLSRSLDLPRPATPAVPLAALPQSWVGRPRAS
jgi:murein tripeptide amidase MpaA